MAHISLLNEGQCKQYLLFLFFKNEMQYAIANIHGDPDKCAKLNPLWGASCFASFPYKY